MLAAYQTIFAQPRDLLLVILAAWIGLSLAERKADRHRVNLELLSNLLLWSTGGFVLGGRILYALEHLSVFVPAPLSLFSLNFSLFDPLGGMAAALVVALINGQRNHLPLWSSLDTLTPFLAAVAAGIAFSHLATGQAFGEESNVPWAIEQWGALRQPTQYYEIIASLIILIIMLIQNPPNVPGRYFLFFLSLITGSQLILQGFHGDNILIFSGLRLEQIIAWVGLALSLFGLEYVAPQADPESITPQSRETDISGCALKSQANLKPSGSNTVVERKKTTARKSRRAK